MGKTRVDVIPDVRITMPGDSTGCINTAQFNSVQSVLRFQSLNKTTGCNTIETDNTGYISSGKAPWESFPGQKGCFQELPVCSYIVNTYLVYLLAPSGALIAIPTY